MKCNFLIPLKNSLILKIFSLIICVGNCSGSGCGAAVSWSSIVSLSPRIAKFPVKFPDTREFAGRLVRSALRRQPGSHAVEHEFLGRRERTANSGVFPIRLSSPCSHFAVSGGRTPKSLRLNSQIFPFCGDPGRRHWFERHCVLKVNRKSRSLRRLGIHISGNPSPFKRRTNRRGATLHLNFPSR